MHAMNPRLMIKEAVPLFIMGTLMLVSVLPHMAAFHPMLLAFGIVAVWPPGASSASENRCGRRCRSWLRYRAWPMLSGRTQAVPSMSSRSE